MECVILPPKINSDFIGKARMAELVDAADSKSAVRKDVQVRFLFRAPDKKYRLCQHTLSGLFFIF
jgi:hypothetical protein